MQAEAESVAATNQEQKDAQQTYLTLERQKLDLESLRIQVLLGLSGIFIICLLNYFPLLYLGFISDSMPPFGHIAEVFHGHWQGLLKDCLDNLNKQNPGHNDNPVVLFTFLTDFAVWHREPFGYYLTNIFAHFFSAVFVVLIGIEISGVRGNRLGALAAIWAGFLYALHPLNVLCLPFILSRGYLLFSLLYFAAVLFFLRFQLLRERQYLVWSSLCAFLALSVDEAAMTLPVVLSLAQLFLAPPNPNRPPQKPLAGSGLALKARQLVIDTWPFWALAAVYATMDKHNFASMPIDWVTASTFANLECNLQSVIVKYPDLLTVALLGLTAALAGLGVLRLGGRNFNWCPYLFLVLWAVAALAAPFDRSHFHPGNSSASDSMALAPVSILLATLALPALDARGAKSVPAWTALGCALLAALSVCWSLSLQLNLAESMRRQGTGSQPSMHYSRSPD